MTGQRMRDLALKVGCTESLISKIESGRVQPSVAMLHRLVEALGRDMSSFFGTDLGSPGVVLKNGERPLLLTDPLREGSGITYERLVPFAAGNLLECNIHNIEPDSVKNDLITHQGETVGYVIEGQLELTIELDRLPFVGRRLVLLPKPFHQQLSQSWPGHCAGALGEYTAGSLALQLRSGRSLRRSAFFLLREAESTS